MRIRSFYVFLLLTAGFFCSCSSSKKAFSPNKKYSPEELRADYRLFRNILEESHPSLYWFTPRDSMDHYFDAIQARLTDSMSQRDFRSMLSYVVSKIRCGHTAVRYSKQYSSYLDTAKLKVFPLSVKVWNDTMVVVANLNRKDSVLKRGTIIKSVDGHPVGKLIDTLFNFLSSDGYADVAKYQSLSNRGNFGAYYKNIFGLKDSISIGYLDGNGRDNTIRVPVYDPAQDTGSKKPVTDVKKPTREEIRYITLQAGRNVQVDTTLHSAYMTVNTFSRGHHLKSFFRKSFKSLQQLGIRYLIIDVRTNGGGDASNSTRLTRYLINGKFKIADSLYAIKKSSRFSKYIEMQPLYWLMMQFITHKGRDGNFHFGYLERHYYKPRKKHHFNGEVYLLTGGNSFSATAILAKKLKGQSNITIIGEETGGGAYGNSAWMLPDVTLPNTGIRFTLPKFRLVMDKNLVTEGRGVMPDILVSPSAEAIRRGYDPKVEVVREIIEKKNGLR
jgi:hypothetical protein